MLCPPKRVVYVVVIAELLELGAVEAHATLKIEQKRITKVVYVS